MARRTPGKTKSGFPNTSKWRLQPVIPACRKSFNRRSSVLRLPLELICDITFDRARSVTSCPEPRGGRALRLVVTLERSLIRPALSVTNLELDFAVRFRIVDRL